MGKKKPSAVSRDLTNILTQAHAKGCDLVYVIGEENFKIYVLGG